MLSPSTVFRSETERSKAKRKLSMVLVTYALACTAVGCGNYPEVSPATFELAKALSTVCNSRDPSQLEKARSAISSKFEAGQINEKENRYLSRIVEMAEDGDWEQAEKETHRLLQDQTDW